MKKLNLTALLLGAALFTGLGAVSLSASDMKCGAGKCGSSVKKPMKKESAMKCGAGMKEMKGKKEMTEKKEMKKMKKMKKNSMKCGKGKCGSN